MSDQIVAFFLSLGILGALIAWGLMCGVWHRQDPPDESLSSPESFREHPALLAEWWKK